MSLKTDILDKHIKDIEQFVAERIGYDPTHTVIKRSLANLRGSLGSGKLCLKIISSDLAQAETFKELLGLGHFSQERFSIDTAGLPMNLDFDSTSSTGLILQNLDEATRYDLAGSDRHVIGRNPEKVQVLLPDELSLVSGAHAELQYVDGSWQIQDLNSTNGTYINSSLKKLEDFYTVEDGDQICLGSSSGIPGSADILFEDSDQPKFSLESAKSYALLNCDVMCFLTDLSQPFSETSKYFLEQAGKASITKRFVIAVMSDVKNPQIAKKNLAEIENWIDSQPIDGTLELIPLLLHQIVPSPRATVLMPHAQPDFEKLCQALKGLEASDVEALTIQRVIFQLSTQLTAFETILTNQAKTLKHEIRRDEKQLRLLTQGDLKDRVSKALNRVNSERELFFKQVKAEINQSRAGLLDEFRQSSLPFKIQQFAKRLKPVVAVQKGYCHIRLQLDENAKVVTNAVKVHDAATHLCQSKLTQWADEEWRHICTVYGGGGLKNLFRRSRVAFPSVPNLALHSFLLQAPQNFDIQSILQVSLVDPVYGLRYKQMSFLGYLFKNAKGQVISYLAMVTLVTGAFLPEGLLPDNFKAKAAGPLLIIIAISLFWTYRQEKAIKVEEAVEKLQKEICDHYQSLTKSLAERIVQQFGFVMEAEERRQRETLDSIKEQYFTYINDLEKHQLQLKAQIDESKKTQQRMIGKDLPELHKLKRELLVMPNHATSNPAESSKRSDRLSSSKRKLEAS